MVRNGNAQLVEFVTVGEFAAQLGISRATVYKAVAAGAIPHLRVSNAIRIPLDYLEGALAARTPEGTKVGRTQQLPCASASAEAPLEAQSSESRSHERT